MNFSRCWTLAQFELNRLFLTKRGLVALVAFCLFWYLILTQLVSRGAELLQSKSFRSVAEDVFGRLGLETLYSWPMPELVVFWLVAIFIFPLSALLVSADQTASDRERGTLRFLTLRCSRTEILLGRFFGALLIIVVLIGMALTATVVMGFYNGSPTVPQSLKLGATLWFHLSLAVLPFIALTAVFNCFLRSARQVVLAALLFLGFGGILISVIVDQIPALNALNYLLPGHELTALLSDPGESVQAYIQPLLQTFALFAVAMLINQRSAL